MEYRGIILDFYGTLVHEDDQIVSSICDRIAKSSKMDIPRQDIGSEWWSAFSRLSVESHGGLFIPQRQIALQSLEGTIEHFGASLDASQLIEEQFAQWKAPELFSETSEFLEWLRGSKLLMCVASNIDRSDIASAIAFHSLEIQHVLTSEDVSSYKPRAELFTAALEVLDLKHEEVLHVGDSRTSDVAGAIAAGIPVAWLNRSGKYATHDNPPTHTIQNLIGLIELLE